MSHPPIDPSSPLPPHCEPKKDAEQNARWGLISDAPPTGHSAAAAEAQENEAEAQAKAVEVEPGLDAKSSEKTHEEL